MKDTDDFGYAFPTNWAAFAPILQRLGTLGARDHVMARTEETISFTVHADGALAVGVGAIRV